ncbi:MAG: hypothetical protein AAGA54_13565 [Myxococcota bacterium]
MMFRNWIAHVRVGAAGLLVAAIAGCFTDVETPMNDCEEGTLGCECISGVCGAELQCATEANVCISADCTPGNNGCVCDTGSRCDAPFVCSVGVCMPEQTGTGTGDSATGGMSTTASTTAGSMSTTSTSMSTTNVDTTATMTTEGMTTEVLTTDADTSSSSSDESSSTTDAPLDCIEETAACDDCFACTDGPGQACESASESCAGLFPCPEIITCLDTCAADGLCFEDCCEGRDPASVMLALELHQCHRSSCASASCLNLPMAMCN